MRVSDGMNVPSACGQKGIPAQSVAGDGSVCYRATIYRQTRGRQRRQAVRSRSVCVGRRERGCAAGRLTKLCTTDMHGHGRCARFPTRMRPFPQAEVPLGRLLSF